MVKVCLSKLMGSRLGCEEFQWDKHFFTKRMRNSSKWKCLTNSVEYDDKYLVVRILDLNALIRIWFCKIKALSM